MPPKEKKPKKGDKKKAAKLAELQQKMEELHQKEQEEVLTEELQYRREMLLNERLSVAELRLDRNRNLGHFLVERKLHDETQEKLLMLLLVLLVLLLFEELVKTSTNDRNTLEKAIASLTKSKEMLEAELAELTEQAKAQAEELFGERKRLEMEMSERGNCFMCPDCSRQVYQIIRQQGLAAQLLRREAAKQNYDLGKA
eukprot:GGOE01056382.1.p1 GENE.GGOE01056382.1~~GGOE01056382.1.p1  ORF type:complete len:199 (+),score=90.54 GGOE01056382.1:263-859(+)